MARQARTATAPLTPTKWSRKFMEYAMEANFFGRSGLLGEGEDSLIRIYKDLSKEKGTKVRVPMTGELTGVGGGDNYNSEDLLEAYDTFYMDVVVHERGHTTGIDGPMSGQHMIEDWPAEATKKLARWKGRIMEKEIINALSGVYNLATTVESVNEHAPTAYRIAYGGEPYNGTAPYAKSAIWIGGTSDIDLGSSGGFYTDALLSASGETATNYLMGPHFIEAAFIQFLNSEPRPQPMMIEGRECFLLLMTPGQAYDLRNNTTYQNRNMYAEVRGSKNPLLSTSMGFWSCGEHLVLLKPYGRILSRTGAGTSTPAESFTLDATRTAAADEIYTGKTVGRSLLLGAQAGAIAYGGGDNKMLFKRTKGDLDHGTGRKPFYGVDWIYGVSKTEFSDEAGTAQKDYACMCLDTCQTTNV